MKFVVASRHPGAARGALSLARAAAGRRFDIEFISSDPAYSILSAANLQNVHCLRAAHERYPGLRAYTGPERIENADLGAPGLVNSAIREMAGWLREFLKHSRPDAVVMADANEQLGVDQIISIAAGDLGIPAVRIRDSWGIGRGVETSATRGIVDESLRRRAMAARYLEIDRQGAKLSVRRLGIPEDRLVVIDGLYTLDRLVGHLTAERRRAARAALGVDPQQPLVVYFAQPTRGDDAEPHALRALVAALNEAGLHSKGVVIATQEHPREADPEDGRLGLGWTATQAAAVYRGRVLDLTPGVVGNANQFEQTMEAADIFVSSYSNSSIEATALGATAAAALSPEQRPIGLFILCPDVVRDTLARRRGGLRLVPFAENGAVPYADVVEDIGPLVTDLLFRPERRQHYFERMSAQYRVGRCSARVLEETLQLVTASRVS